MQTTLLNQHSPETFATRTALFLALPVLTVLSGCSANGKSAEVAEYTYHWRDGIDAPWTAYSVSSSAGRRLIGEWIASHFKELAISEKYRDMAWVPSNVLAEVYSEGKRRTHLLRRSYPVDPDKPRAMRSYATNQSREEIDELRAIFIERGVRVEPSANPLGNDE